jgi:preprotein translocase subunit YajC
MHMNLFSAIVAFMPPANGQGGQQPSMITTLIPMALVGIVFYFVLIRPQQLRAKQQAKLLSGLKSGDKVATSAGIIAVVITVKDKTVTLRSADSKFEVTKASITEILESGTTTES